MNCLATSDEEICHPLNGSPCQPNALSASALACMVPLMVSNTKRRADLAARIYQRLRTARGLDDAERWQHALFFAMSPQERCHFSLNTARSALSLKHSATK